MLASLSSRGALLQWAVGISGIVALVAWVTTRNGGDGKKKKRRRGEKKTTSGQTDEVEPWAEVILVRHGERLDHADPAWKNRVHELGLEVRDPPLSSLGHAQARETASHMRQFLEGRGRLKLWCSPYLRVIQTAQPLADALGLKLCLEEGLAETSHIPGCLPSATARYAYFPCVDTRHKTRYRVAATSACLDKGTVDSNGTTLPGSGRPQEGFPEDYMKRMAAFAPIIDANVVCGETLIGYTHAASNALAAALLKVSINDVGHFAPCGLLILRRRGAAGTPWELARKGDSNAPYVPEELQSTHTYPWTFKPEQLKWWDTDILPTLQPKSQAMTADDDTEVPAAAPKVEAGGIQREVIILDEGDTDSDATDFDADQEGSPKMGPPSRAPSPPICLRGETSKKTGASWVSVENVNGASVGAPPAAIGSVVCGDLINFAPEPTEEDPTGCLRLIDAFTSSVLRHGMKVVGQKSVIFLPENSDTRPGFTSAVLLDASHCSAHCYSDTRQLAIDCFTCGSTNPKLIYDDAVEAIKLMSPGVQVSNSTQLPRFDSAAPGLVRKEWQAHGSFESVSDGMQ